MIASTLTSIVERRLLVNYRVAADVAAVLLPAQLRPQIRNGWAVAGICLIRLGHTRPAWTPARFGLRSENAAHRIAVEWDGPDGVQTGVYIPRRDSGSIANVLVGGRVFPGEHSFATFDVRETASDMHVAFASRDGATHVDVDAVEADELGASELFDGVDGASKFFRKDAKGYSATRTGRSLDGLELRTDAWRVRPMAVRSVRSSYFDDRDRFPSGSAAIDCALVMRDVPVAWRVLPAMRLAG